MPPIVSATTTTIAFLDAADEQSIAALDAVESLNLVAMPALSTLQGDAYDTAVAAIAAYCARRRAFFIVDPPADWTSVDAVTNGIGRIAAIVKENGAIYWPPLASGPPSRAVASVYAATDTAEGVWKAPAGIGAGIGEAPTYQLTDAQNGLLNPLGVNCIRTFPVYGTVVWGARTLDGAEVLESQWKYLNVRRLTLFIETSIYQSLNWTVFEPNAEPLWSAIRQSIFSFLTGLWSSGAFAGASQSQAFFVTCDSTTTTPDDIEQGIVNVIVAFAPVMPAEFIVLSITLMSAAPA